MARPLAIFLSLSLYLDVIQICSGVVSFFFLPSLRPSPGSIVANEQRERVL